MTLLDQRAGVAGFLTDLTQIAPPAGRGDYTFASPGGGHGFVQLIVKSHDTLVIHRLWTLQPRQGIGSFMLQALCDLADRHAVVLMLKVIPIGRKPYPLSRDQLLVWYQRYGFDGTRKKMMRPPREPHTSPTVIGCESAAHLEFPVDGGSPRYR